MERQLAEAQLAGWLARAHRHADGVPRHIRQAPNILDKALTYYTRPRLQDKPQITRQAPDYKTKPQITIQGPDYYTRPQQLDKAPATRQGPNSYTRSQLLDKAPDLGPRARSLGPGPWARALILGPRGPNLGPLGPRGTTFGARFNYLGPLGPQGPPWAPGTQIWTQGGPGTLWVPYWPFVGP